jgi:arsenate reductase-like glutaredoxin family protein
MKKLLVVLVVVGLGYFGYLQVIAEGETKLDALYELPYVVVYGKTTCGWTQKCLRELKEQNIDAIFENIDKHEVKMEIFPRIDAAGHNRNRISIPIVDVNGHILIGYEPEKILAFYQQY